jgi:hypothetical protein
MALVERKLRESQFSIEMVGIKELFLDFGSSKLQCGTNRFLEG